MNLDHLSRGEVEGAYRRLCASMIAHSAFVLADRGLSAGSTKTTLYYRGEIKRQREAAREWMYGGDAVLPFAEACSALDMDEDGVREGLERFLNNPDLTLSRRWRRRDVPRSRPAISTASPEQEE